MIFVDMDGTLAKFYKDSKCLENMYKENFFLNLKPYKLVNYINELAKKTKVFILSACVESEYCCEEKVNWVHKYLPNIKDNQIILCETGENKAKIANEYLEKHNLYNDNVLLIDDYSENLYNWDRFKDTRFKSIKFINGINDKTNKDYKLKFKTIPQLKKILSSMNEI